MYISTPLPIASSLSPLPGVFWLPGDYYAAPGKTEGGTSVCTSGGWWAILSRHQESGMWGYVHGLFNRLLKLVSGLQYSLDYQPGLTCFPRINQFNTSTHTGPVV